MSKRTAGILLVIITTLITLPMLAGTKAYAAAPTEPHNANSVWVEPSSINLTNQLEGYRFNVTVYANITTIPADLNTSGHDSIGGWQVKLSYNNTVLNVTRTWPAVGKTAGQSQFFENITIQSVSPVFGSNYVQFGESWKGDVTSGPFAYPPIMGGLCIVEFNLTARVPVGGNKTTILDLKTNWPSKAYVVDYDSIGDVLNTANNSIVTLPVVPEFATVAYILLALIATSAIPLLARKSLKRPKPPR